MNSAGAAEAIFIAVAGALNVAAFTALSTGGIYGWVPELSAFPFTRIEYPRKVPFACFSNPGADCTIDLHFFSQYRGDLQLARLAAKAEELLDRDNGNPLPVTGFGSVSIALESTELVPGEEVIAGVRTTHAVSTYRVQMLQV